MPKFSSLVDRISGKGSNAWVTHFQAIQDRKAGRDVVILSIGDPDFATPKPIVESAIDAMRSGDTHYSEIAGRPLLREAVAKELMLVSGSDTYEVSPENVMIMAGTQNALFGASLCLLEQGDEIIAFDPMYVTYSATWQTMGARIKSIPCPRENDFHPNIDEIESAISDKTKAIVFANPNNPTGVVLKKSELEAIAKIAIKHDLWVITDEVYSAQTYEKKHTSIAALDGMKERTVTCGGLSKSQAMTGWRIGWMAGPKTLIEHCEKLGLAMLYGVAGFIQEAAIDALTDSRSQIEKMLEIYKTRRALVASKLNDIENVELVVPDAGMFVLLDVSKLGMNASEFSAKLYAKEVVSVLDGAAFGEPTKNCVRIAFTTNEEELTEGCRRIKKFINELKGG